jgi:LacI family transcriptional regulator
MSVIAQPAYDMGVRAAQLLLDRILRKAPASPRTVMLSTTLVVRASSRRGDRTHPKQSSSRVGSSESAHRID